MLTVEEHLHHQSKFQQLLIDLAIRFINLPVAQMETEIVAAMQQIVEFLGNTAIAVNQISENYDSYTALYRYLNTGEIQINRMTPLPSQRWVIPILERGDPIIIADSEQLPDEDHLRQLLKQENLRTLCVVPLLRQGSLFGFVSMSWDQVHVIDQDYLDLLRIVGAIFLNAIERKETDERLQTLNETLEQRVELRTHELVLVNEQLEAEIQQHEETQLALKHSEQQLRTILEVAAVPMILTNGQRKLIYVNASAADLLGFDPDNLNNYEINTLFVSPNDQEILAALLARDGLVKNYEVNFRTLKGTTGYGLTSVHRIQIDGQNAVLTVLVDITELKKVQELEQAHRNHIEALLDSAMALTSTLEIDDVLGHILGNLSRVLPHDVSNIMVADEDDIFIFRQTVETNADLSTSSRQSLKADGLTGTVSHLFEIDYPVLVTDTQQSPLLIPDFENQDVRSYVGLPVVVGKEVIGFLNLGSYQRDYFNETHINYLQIFALQAGSAIQNARLFKQAQTIAALEERQHLARELHDSVTQTLFSANTIAEALPTIMEKAPQKASEYLNELHLLTRGAMSEMRSLLFELRPATIAQTDICVLLGELCHTFTGQTRIVVETQLPNKMPLAPDIQLAFYRIAQETFNNIVKYARASHVTLKLSQVDQWVELSISDDGKGFDPKVIKPGHFGLKMMQERADAVHAELSIQSQPGSGTQIRLRRQLS